MPDVLLGRHWLDETVGSGGFGTIYRGFDEHLQRLVAIKILQRRAARPIDLAPYRLFR